jgi:hypothetical protein
MSASTPTRVVRTFTVHLNGRQPLTYQAVVQISPYNREEWSYSHTFSKCATMPYNPVRYTLEEVLAHTTRDFYDAIMKGIPIKKSFLPPHHIDRIDHSDYDDTM